MSRCVAMEETDLFRAYTALGDRIWNIVAWWTPLAVDTVGKSLIRSVDDIAAHLIAGDGADEEALHSLSLARTAARETRYWLQRAASRELLNKRESEEMLQTLTEATRQLNGLIRERRAALNLHVVREGTTEYLAEEDPFVVD